MFELFDEQIPVEVNGIGRVVVEAGEEVLGLPGKYSVGLPDILSSGSSFCICLRELRLDPPRPPNYPVWEHVMNRGSHSLCCYELIKNVIGIIV